MMRHFRIRKLTQTEAETMGHAKIVGARATEDQKRWREKYKVSRGLHRKRNAKACRERKHAECPSEPKAAGRYRRWRDGKLGKMGAASKVRRIDPTTGEVIE
jgi:hypothetical protein